MAACLAQSNSTSASGPTRKTVAPNRQSALTTDTVIQMTEAGLSADLIISRLRKSGKSFDLSPAEMIRLKKASVSDRVIEVMLDPTAAPPVGAQPASPAAVEPLIPVVPPLNPNEISPPPSAKAQPDPNDPLAPHDSGIYLFTQDRAGRPLMIVLERAAYQGAKTGGIFASAMTYGIMKAKTKAVLPGPQAAIRTSNPRPEFYFYFEDKSAGLGKAGSGGGVSNPGQFSLIKLEVLKSNRETIISEYGALGASSGTHAKSMVAFKSERLRQGAYKVTLSEAIQPGEYCFLGSSMAAAFGAGATSATDIFDFGINPGE